MRGRLYGLFRCHGERGDVQWNPPIRGSWRRERQRASRRHPPGGRWWPGSWSAPTSPSGKSWSQPRWRWQEYYLRRKTHTHKHTARAHTHRLEYRSQQCKKTKIKSEGLSIIFLSPPLLAWFSCLIHTVWARFKSVWKQGFHCQHREKDLEPFSSNN